MTQRAKPSAYTQVSINTSIVMRIAKIIDTLGYSTVTEFIKEAVREHLRSKESEYDRIKLEKLEAL